ncbi:MAG: hypothetical protein IK095_06430 [Oscillospiraceae bacterium]|nr:hypothetical protein [Oscillospiraceae bacterium]
MATKRERPTLLLLVGLMSLEALIHIVAYECHLARCSAQIITGTVVVLWSLSAHRRIADKQALRRILAIAVWLLVFLADQVIRYAKLPGAGLDRWAWYAYYPPMLFVAQGCLSLALCIYRPREERTALEWGFLALTALLAVCVMTNDLHQFFFRFSGGVMSDTSRVLGPGFYLFFALFAVQLLLTFLITLHKCRQVPGGWEKSLVPLPILLLAAYLLHNAVDGPPKIWGISIWNLGEAFSFATLLFLEACIQTGLIPANVGYEEIFSLSELPAVILDREGRPRYETKGGSWPLPQREDTEIMSHPVTGGSVQWVVDLEQIRRLDRRIQEAQQDLEARIAYLTEENRVQKERTELEVRNRLYDRISTLLAPQLEQLRERLADPDVPLAPLAVLVAYIKRRSNMELLAEEGRLPFEELKAALAESLEYLRLCGVESALSAPGAGSFSAELVTAAYEQAEDVIEESLEDLRALMVNIRAEEQALVLRMMLKAESFSFSPVPQGRDSAGSRRQVSITKDGQDVILMFRFSERGDAL